MKIGYVGHLLASLGLDTKEFNRSLNAANAQMNKAGISMAKTGSLIKTVFRGMAGAGAIGIAIAAATGLVVVIGNLIKKSRELSIEQKMMNSVNAESTKQFIVQKGEIKALTSIIENNNLSNEARLEAISALKEIMPGYNGQLTAEGELIGHNVTQINDYVEALKKKIQFQVLSQKYADAFATQQAAQDAVLIAIEKLSAAQKEANEYMQQSDFNTPLESQIILMNQYQSAVEKANKDLKNQIIQLETANNIIAKIEEKMQSVDYSGLGALGVTPEKAKKEGLKKPKYNIPSFGLLMDQVESEFMTMDDIINKNTENVYNWRQVWGDASTAVGEALIKANEQLYLHNQIANELTTSFSAMFATAKDGWKGLGDVISAELERIAREIAAKAATWAIMSILFPGSSFLKQGFKAFMGWTPPVPAMAGGGLVYGDTLARVGEYSGASSNPEVIAPLDKLKSIMGSSSGRMTVEGKISGKDLALVLRRNS